MNATHGLGARLRLARERAGYNQHDAAGAAGVVRELISYWENGHRTPGLGQLSRLAEVYGVTTGYLLGTEPEPTATEEHALIYRGLGDQPPQSKAEVRRWLAFLEDWASLRDACGDVLPGLGVPPKPTWRAPSPVTDSRRAPTLAAEVRAHFKLGDDAIPDLLAFLDQKEVLVYRIALDPVADGRGVSGVFYNHPRLGYCILVNTNTTPGRQVFTLAHEFAHALFHYQEKGLVSRAGVADRKERFADDFAAHFLVPGEALRRLVVRGDDGCIESPFEVIRLHRYFRVSYATMLNRLRSEGLLDPERYQEYSAYSPKSLARRLGFDSRHYQAAPDVDGISLGTYPTSVLQRIRSLVEDDGLSPVGAADLLGVSTEEVLDKLLADPEDADDIERREFSELPRPLRPR